MIFFTGRSRAFLSLTLSGGLFLCAFLTSCTVYYATAQKRVERDGIYADEVPQSYPDPGLSDRNTSGGERSYYGAGAKLARYDSLYQAKDQEPSRAGLGKGDLSQRSRTKVKVTFYNYYWGPYGYAYPYGYVRPYGYWHWRRTGYPYTAQLPQGYTEYSPFFYPYSRYDPAYERIRIPSLVTPPSRTYPKNPRYDIQYRKNWVYSTSQRSRPPSHPYRSSTATQPNRSYKASKYPPVYASKSRSVSRAKSSHPQKRKAAREQSACCAR